MVPTQKVPPKTGQSGEFLDPTPPLTPVPAPGEAPSASTQDLKNLEAIVQSVGISLVATIFTRFAAPATPPASEENLPKLLKRFRELQERKEKAALEPASLGLAVGAVEPGYELATHDSQGRLILRYETKQEADVCRDELRILTQKIGALAGKLTGSEADEAAIREYLERFIWEDASWTREHLTNLNPGFLLEHGLKSAAGDALAKEAAAAADPEEKRTLYFEALQHYTAAEHAGKIRTTIQTLKQTLPLLPKNSSQLAERMELTAAIAEKVEGAEPTLAAELRKSALQDAQTLVAQVREGRTDGVVPDPMQKLRALLAVHAFYQSMKADGEARALAGSLAGAARLAREELKKGSFAAQGDARLELLKNLVQAELILTPGRLKPPLRIRTSENARTELRALLAEWKSELSRFSDPALRFRHGQDWLKAAAFLDSIRYEDINHKASRLFSPEEIAEYTQFAREVLKPLLRRAAEAALPDCLFSGTWEAKEKIETGVLADVEGLAANLDLEKGESWAPLAQLPFHRIGALVTAAHRAHTSLVRAQEGFAGRDVDAWLAGIQSGNTDGKDFTAGLENSERAAAEFAALGLKSRVVEAMAPFRSLSVSNRLAAEERCGLLFKIAQTYQGAGLKEETDEIFAEAAALDGPDATAAVHQSAQLARAMQKLNAGDMDGARADLDGIPENTVAKTLLGQITEGQRVRRVTLTVNALRGFSENFLANGESHGHDVSSLKTDTRAAWDEIQDLVLSGKSASIREAIREVKAEGRFPGFRTGFAVDKSGRFAKPLDEAPTGLEADTQDRPVAWDIDRFLETVDHADLSDDDFDRALFGNGDLLAALNRDGYWLAYENIVRSYQGHPRHGVAAKEYLEALPNEQRLRSTFQAFGSLVPFTSGGSFEDTAMALVPLGAGRALGAGAERLFLRAAARGALAETPLALRIGGWALRSGGEALGFTLGGMALRTAFTGKTDHWTFGNFFREWGGMMVTFGLMHGAGMATASRGSVLQWGARVGASAGAEYLNEFLGLKEKEDGVDLWTRLFSGAVLDAQMFVSGKLVNKVSGGRLEKLEAGNRQFYQRTDSPPPPAKDIALEKRAHELDPFFASGVSVLPLMAGKGAPVKFKWAAAPGVVLPEGKPSAVDHGLYARWTGEQVSVAGRAGEQKHADLEKLFAAGARVDAVPPEAGSAAWSYWFKSGQGNAPVRVDEWIHRSFLRWNSERPAVERLAASREAASLLPLPISPGVPASLPASSRAVRGFRRFEGNDGSNWIVPLTSGNPATLTIDDAARVTVTALDNGEHVLRIEAGKARVTRGGQALVPENGAIRLQENDALRIGNKAFFWKPRMETEPEPSPKKSLLQEAWEDSGAIVRDDIPEWAQRTFRVLVAAFDIPVLVGLRAFHGGLERLNDFADAFNDAYPIVRDAAPPKPSPAQQPAEDLTDATRVMPRDPARADAESATRRGAGGKAPAADPLLADADRRLAQFYGSEGWAQDVELAAFLNRRISLGGVENGAQAEVSLGLRMKTAVHELESLGREIRSRQNLEGEGAPGLETARRNLRDRLDLIDRFEKYPQERRSVEGAMSPWFRDFQLRALQHELHDRGRRPERPDGVAILDANWRKPLFGEDFAAGPGTRADDYQIRLKVRNGEDVQALAAEIQKNAGEGQVRVAAAEGDQVTLELSTPQGRVFSIHIGRFDPVLAKRQRVAAALAAWDDAGMRGLAGEVSETRLKAARAYLSYGDAPPADADLSFLDAEGYGYRAKADQGGGGLLTFPGKDDAGAPAWTVQHVEGKNISLVNEAGEVKLVTGEKLSPDFHPFTVGDRVRWLPALAGGSDAALRRDPRPFTLRTSSQSFDFDPFFLPGHTGREADFQFIVSFGGVKNGKARWMLTLGKQPDLPFFYSVEVGGNRVRQERIWLEPGQTIKTSDGQVLRFQAPPVDVKLYGESKWASKLRPSGVAADPNAPSPWIGNQSQ